MAKTDGHTYGDATHCLSVFRIDSDTNEDAVEFVIAHGTASQRIRFTLSEVKDIAIDLGELIGA